MGFAEPVIGPATSGRTRWLYPSHALTVLISGNLHYCKNAAPHLLRFYAQEGFEQREVLDCGGKGGQQA